MTLRCKYHSTTGGSTPGNLSHLLAGLVLAALLSFQVAESGVTGMIPEHPHARALKSKEVPGFSAVLVEETTSSLKKASGPAEPGSNKGDRKDGTSGKKRPPKPGKPEQLPSSDEAVAPGTPVGGRKLHAVGRKLQAVGDPCSVYVKNACRSKKSFQAAFGYYTENGVNSGFLSGWEATGWYTIKYGRKLKFSAWQTLYVLTTNGLVPTRTTGLPATFCVASFPFQILDGDDGYYYALDGASNTYYSYDSCYDAGGYYNSNFWAPSYCGVTLVYKKC